MEEQIHTEKTMDTFVIKQNAAGTFRCRGLVKANWLAFVIIQRFKPHQC